MGDRSAVRALRVVVGLASALVLLLIAAGPAAAEAPLRVTEHVTDLAGVLTAPQEAKLNHGYQGRKLYLVYLQSFDGGPSEWMGETSRLSTLADDDLLVAVSVSTRECWTTAQRLPVTDTQINDAVQRALGATGNNLWDQFGKSLANDLASGSFVLGPDPTTAPTTPPTTTAAATAADEDDGSSTDTVTLIIVTLVGLGLALSLWWTLRTRRSRVPEPAPPPMPVRRSTPAPPPPPVDEGWVLAIDFGTTNTVAVVQDAAEPARVLQFGDLPQLKSAIYLDDDGTWAVGRHAENRAMTDPGRFEPTPKRRIGDRSLFLGGQDIAVTDAIGAVLDTVVREAVRQHGGRTPARVVLTHPASWQSTRLAVLSEAARRTLTTRVGGAELLLLPEPVAASWHAVTAADLPIPCRVAVFDLGGGTLDISLLDRDRSPGGTDNFTPAGTPCGIDPLGGEDFDTRLALWVLDQLDQPTAAQRLAVPATATDRAAGLALRRAARDAKETLSETTRAHVWVPPMPPGLPDGRSVQIGREQFENLVIGDLHRATRLLTDAIDTAPVGPPLAAVVLVGGSSRIPLLGRLLTEATGRTPIEHGDTATAVARGAARWARHDLRNSITR